MPRPFSLKRISSAVSSALGVVAVLSIGCQEATAQQPERVTVTGSAIKRIEAEGALPVQTFSRDQIEKTGAASIAELIQSLPAMQGFVQVSDSVGGGGGGFASASLRSLGQRTLVLLNGRRIASWAGQTLTGYGDGIDLNTVPLAAIERVEVLTDGASALYGSDAIAGVVNFITRTNFEKFEVFAGYLQPQESGGKEKRVSLTKGWGNPGRDGYNVLISYNKDTADPIRSLDRDFAKTGNIFFSNGGRDLNFANPSSRSIPANVRIGGAFRNPYFESSGGNCPPMHYRDPAGGRFCYFDFVQTLQIQPDQERESFIASASKKFGDNHTGYFEFIHSQSDVLWRIAPAPVDIPIGTTSPFFPIAQSLGATAGVTARLRMMDAGNRTALDTTKADHFVLGVRGLSWGWDYDLSYIMSKNKWTENYPKGWFASNELLAALQSQTINPFVVAGNQSAAGMTAIEGAQFRGQYKEGNTGLDVLSLRGTRETFKAPAGPAMLGAGIDFRWEKADYKPSTIAQGIGNVIAGDSGAERPFDVSRHAWGAFAELQLPLTKTFEATFALRHDDYSDFGGTTNGKASLRWAPTRQWLVRASAGTGFKAPSVPQTANVQQLYGVTGGSYSCPFAATDPLAVGCVPGTTQYNVYAAGNKDLKPEKSKQFSIGTRFEPAQELSLGVDYWNINLTDRIGQLDETTIFANPAAYRRLFTIYTDPTSGDRNLAILLENSNLGEAKASGLDFDVVARFKLPIGNLTSRLLWTHVIEHKVQLAKGGPFVSDLGRYEAGLGLFAGPVFRNQFRWFNSLDAGSWSHTLAINYKSPYTDQSYTEAECLVVIAATGACAAVTREVEAYATADWQTRYMWGRSLKLTAGILNIFDTDPPLTIKAGGSHPKAFDSRFADPRGRTLYINVSYQF